jgi:ATP-binding cassette, subfamily B, bacterial
MHSQNPWQEQRDAASPSHLRSRLLNHLTRHWSNQPRALARARKFLGYYRPYVPLLVADLFCAALVAATAIALPLCASYITTRLPELAQADNGLTQILLMGGAMLVIWLVQAMATYFVDYQGHVMGARIEADVRKELFEHCQKLSFSFYDRQRVGQLMSRISNDSLWLGELFHHGPEDLAIGLLKFVGAMVVLAIIDPVLSGLIVLLLPPAVCTPLQPAHACRAQDQQGAHCRRQRAGGRHFRRCAGRAVLRQRS